MIYYIWTHWVNCMVILFLSDLKWNSSYICLLNFIIISLNEIWRSDSLITGSNTLEVPLKLQNLVCPSSYIFRWRIILKRPLVHNNYIVGHYRSIGKYSSTITVTSPVTGEFPTQRVSNAENVSIWWRHHVKWVSAILCDLTLWESLGRGIPCIQGAL